MEDFFTLRGLMPHGHCFLWKPWLVWIHVISDAVILLSYYSIPLTLLFLVRKKKGVEFSKMYLVFGLFIFACGTTHGLEIYTMWVPAYGVEAVAKMLTALVSLAAAVVLVPAVNQVLLRPTRAELEAAYREIEETNSLLVAAEKKLLDVNSALEVRVQERTAEIESQKKELERSNTELAQFAHVASHDLQEPLRAVSNYSDLLSRRFSDELGEKGQRYLERIVRAVGRMRALLEALLEFSLVDSELSRTEVDLGKLVLDVLEDLGDRSAEFASLEIGELPVVSGNYTQLGRLFQNLLSNALKYRSERPLEVSISADETDTEWCVTVRDNGLGFDQEFAEKVFVIFQRLHPVDEFPGTGIGLPICRRIVEAHGGHMWAKGEKDKGATFSFTLMKGV